jgi:hypothetical protein
MEETFMYDCQQALSRNGVLFRLNEELQIGDGVITWWS